MTKDTNTSVASSNQAAAEPVPTDNEIYNEWAEAQRVSDLPLVDEAIRGFIEDQTGDNATCLVREIMRATKPAVPASQSASEAVGEVQLRKTLKEIALCYPWGTGKKLMREGSSLGWVLRRESTGSATQLAPLTSNLVNSAIAATAAILAAPAAPTDAELALQKLCDQLDGMKRTMFLRPGTGQNYSYLVHEDVAAYVEQARGGYIK